MFRRVTLIQFLAIASVIAISATAWGQQCEANELAKLLDPNGMPGDEFGYSVAIDDDTAVVGARWADRCALDGGAAYVFQWDGSSWIRTAILLPCPCPEYGYFGNSVAISGDTIVIGANDSIGRAYIFQPGANEVWDDGCEDQVARLTASDGEPTDYFGTSVAISGDTAVVGAVGDDDNGSNSGSAYVFEEPPGGWMDMTENAKLTACDADSDSHFGVSVAIEGVTLIIGAYVNDNENGSHAGSAYVFEEGAGWAYGCTNQVAKLLASDGAAGDEFGFPVGISGNTLVIGAYTGAGSAYVFERGANGVWDDGWVDQAAILAASDNPWEFGYGAAISGDIVVIGTRYADTAYVYVKPDGGWVDKTEDATLTASDNEPGDLFGHCVAIDGDKAVIGAERDDARKGSAYAFHGLSDCQPNDVLDICDIVNGTSQDLNGNGIPDECEPECDLCIGDNCEYTCLNVGNVVIEAVDLDWIQPGETVTVSLDYEISGTPGDTICVGLVVDGAYVPIYIGQPGQTGYQASAAVPVNAPRPWIADPAYDVEVAVAHVNSLAEFYQTVADGQADTLIIGELEVNPCGDLSGDDYVSLVDLAILLAHYGETCPP